MKWMATFEARVADPAEGTAVAEAADWANEADPDRTAAC